MGAVRICCLLAGSISMVVSCRCAGVRGTVEIQALRHRDTGGVTMWIVVAFVAGGMLGVVMMCLLQINRGSDSDIHR